MSREYYSWLESHPCLGPYSNRHEYSYTFDGLPPVTEYRSPYAQPFLPPPPQEQHQPPPSQQSQPFELRVNAEPTSHSHPFHPPNEQQKYAPYHPPQKQPPSPPTHPTATGGYPPTHPSSYPPPPPSAPLMAKEVTSYNPEMQSTDRSYPNSLHNLPEGPVSNLVAPEGPPSKKPRVKRWVAFRPQNVSTYHETLPTSPFAPAGPLDKSLLRSRADIVMPLDASSAATKTQYSTETIARDVLIASGRHPTENCLNYHLLRLRDFCPQLWPQADLSTFRWDLVDPDERAAQSRDSAASSFGAGAVPRPTQPEPLVPANTTTIAAAADARPAVNTFTPIDNIIDRNTSPLVPQLARAQPQKSNSPARQQVSPTLLQPSPFPHPPAQQISSQDPSNSAPLLELQTEQGALRESSNPIALPEPQAQQSLPPNSSKSTPLRQLQNYQEGSRESSKPSPLPQPQRFTQFKGPAVAPKMTGKRPPGRPPKNSKTQPPNITVFVEPPVKYPVYRCGWDNCRAALHNLELLKKHVSKIHVPHASTCQWKGCCLSRDLPAAQLIKHVTKEHIQTIAWKLGDGPSVPTTGDDGARKPSGSMIIPGTNQQDGEDSLIFPATFTSIRAFNRVHGNHSQHDKAMGILKAVRRQKEHIGFGLDPGGCQLATPARNERVSSGDFYEIKSGL